MRTTKILPSILLAALVAWPCFETPSATGAMWPFGFRQRVCRAKKPSSSPQELGSSLSWHDSYRDAVAEARHDGKMLLILFRAAGDASQCDSLDDGVLAHPEISARLKHFVRLRVPLDVTIRQQGKSVALIDQSAFDEMLGRQGIAIIDFAHPNAEYYETVVSCFPMLDGQPYSADQARVILDLPAGTLTQRTLIYAVRVHPERPASTDGQLEPNLVEEAESHSIHQASIRLQGHHNWEGRFHRINRRLRGRLIASEVCAESWPGEGLLQGAIECVRCWRLSSGHWRAVCRRHRCYGYDMQRGSNGVWYATGIFGSRQ